MNISTLHLIVCVSKSSRITSERGHWPIFEATDMGMLFHFTPSSSFPSSSSRFPSQVLTCIYGSYRGYELRSGTDQTIPTFASHKIQLSPAVPSLATRIGVGMSCIRIPPILLQVSGTIVGLKKERGGLLQAYDGYGVNTQSLVSEPPRVFLFLTSQLNNVHLWNTSRGWRMERNQSFTT